MQCVSKASYHKLGVKLKSGIQLPVRRWHFIINYIVANETLKPLQNWLWYSTCFPSFTLFVSTFRCWFANAILTLITLV